MKCLECKYWTMTNKRPLIGDCRRYAPKVLQVAGTDGYGNVEAHVWEGWPQVKAEDSCGDYSLDDTISFELKPVSAP